MVRLGGSWRGPIVGTRGRVVGTRSAGHLCGGHRPCAVPQVLCWQLVELGTARRSAKWATGGGVLGARSHRRRRTRKWQRRLAYLLRWVVVWLRRSRRSAD